MDESQINNQPTNSQPLNSPAARPSSPPVAQDSLHELLIIVQDKFFNVGRKWLYSVIITFVLCFPIYFGLRTVFANMFVAQHHFPAIKAPDETKQPLEISASKIFKYSDGTYSGYLKIKNANLEWGVANQPYQVVLETTGGTHVTTVSGNTFVLPGSEKIVLIGRFTSKDLEPTVLVPTLGPSEFVRKPERPAPKIEVQRRDLNIIDGHLVVMAAIKNDTPFTIKQIGLPVFLYDAANSIIGVNYTNVNDVKYQETRSFQFAWPETVDNAVRAEVLPEVNVFNPDIYQLAPGQSPFDN